MKKIISLILALVMAMSLAVTAMAEDTHAGTSGAVVTIKTDGSATAADPKMGDSWTFDIPAEYKEDTVTADDVKEYYYVEVKWTVTSSLTYTVGKDAYTWNVYNAENKKSTNADYSNTATKAGYEVDKSKGTWTGDATVTMEIKNWSNRAVKVSYSYKDATAVEDKIPVTIKTENNISSLTGNSILAASNGVEVKDGKTTTTPGTITATPFKITKVTDGYITEDNATIGTLTVTIAKADAVTPGA